jgi:hypothetical protein
MGFDGESDQPRPAVRKGTGRMAARKEMAAAARWASASSDELVVRSYRVMLKDGQQRGVFQEVVLNKEANAELENQIATLDAELRTTRRLVTKGVFNEHEYVETKAQVDAEKKELRDAIQLLNSEYSTENKLYSADELWDEFTVHQKRDALSLLIERINIKKAPSSPKGRQFLNPDRVDIMWKTTSGAIGIAPKSRKLLAVKTP